MSSDLQKDLNQLKLVPSQRFHELSLSIHGVNILLKIHSEKLLKSLYEQIPMKWLSGLGAQHLTIELFEATDVIRSICQQQESLEGGEDDEYILSKDYFGLKVRPGLVKVFFLNQEVTYIFKILKAIVPEYFLSKSIQFVEATAVMNKKGLVDLYFGNLSERQSLINFAPMHKLLCCGSNLIFKKNDIFYLDILPWGQELLNVQRLGQSYVIDNAFLINEKIKNTISFSKSEWLDLFKNYFSDFIITDVERFTQQVCGATVPQFLDRKDWAHFEITH